MFVHEYDRAKDFSSYEECRDDLFTHIDAEDYAEHLECTTFEEVIRKFLSRKSDKEFLEWFQDLLADTEVYIENDLITEYEEDE
jgi:hypothetical protein